MPGKILHRTKKRSKKHVTYINLLILFFLVATTFFIAVQGQQKQTFLQHAQTSTCGKPGDKGNNMGVGKYCTQGGGQCLGTGAPICSADIQLEGQGICSKVCNTDADCGTGATCYQDTLGKGCKPDICDSTPPTATPQPTKIVPTSVPTLKLAPTAIPTKVLPTNTPTANPLTTALQLSVYLHGIGNSGDSRNQLSTLSNKNPVHPQRTFTITVTDLQSHPVKIQQTILSYDTTKGLYTGDIELSNSFTTGTYVITIKTASFLQKTVPSVTILHGKNYLSPVYLTAGDINNDNAIDLLDYNTIINCLSILSPALSCSNSQKLSSDLNDDGKVDQTDYNLFLREISILTIKSS